MYPTQVTVDIERKPVHRNAARNADSDCRDLAGGSRWAGGTPHAAAAIDGARCDAEFGTGRDDRGFHSAYVGNNIERVWQRNDWIGDKLARSVPSDSSATIYVDHGGSVGRAVSWFRPTTSREYRFMFQDQHSWWQCASSDFSVD